MPILCSMIRVTDPAPDRYVPEIGFFLDRLMLIFAGALLAAVPLNHFSGNTFFVYYNLVIAGMILSIFMLRRSLLILLQIVLLLCAGYAHVIPSMAYSGLIGTGFIMMATLQVLAIVFLRTRTAIILGSSAVAVTAGFAAMVGFGVITYAPPVLARMNSGQEWIIRTISVAAYLLLATTTVQYLRSRMFQAIDRLQVINAELTAMKDHAEHLAYYDELTGLPNRHSFHQHVERRIAAGCGPAALLLLDLRRFRLINSIYGGEHGDQILITIARVLQEHRPAGLYLARMSGDEFAGWFEYEEPQQLFDALLEFRHIGRAALAEVHPHYDLSYCAAYSLFPEHGGDYGQCFMNTGIAMRQAKLHGSSSVLAYTPDMGDHVHAENLLEAELKQAVRDENFTLVYQPKIDIHTRQVLGVEALARWNSPRLGDIPPARFIPALTHSSLIEGFTLQILQQAARDLGKLQGKFGPSITIAVNISPAVALSPEFPQQCCAILQQYRIDPAAIILEITEDILITELETARTAVARFRSLGIRVSLDDFGTGYAGLSYLRNIPFHELKIDRSFVQDIAENPRSLHLFRIICEMAELFGFSVIAEGVETEAQHAALRESSCRIAQGFYYARPENL